MRILHIFDHACNLLNERGEVLSVVSQKIGNGPFNLVVKGNDLCTELLSTHFPVFIQAGQLHIGDWIIQTEDADIWCPRPNWERLYREKVFILNRLFQLEMPISQFDDPLVSKLAYSIANEDLGTAKALAFQLAGLGQGLTPSGDDILLGATFAAWIIHPLDVAAKIAKEITDIAAPQTASLSAAWLRSAGNGEAGGLWHELLSALLFENAIQAQAALDKILAVGETSGADALTGFIGTLISHSGHETKSCYS
ncbi:MAG: DUF2877 domain-containing protein [Chloroflexota bacterium]